MSKTLPLSQKKHKTRRYSSLSIVVLTLLIAIFNMLHFNVPDVHAAEVSLA
jgi:hypothetical protein